MYDTYEIYDIYERKIRTVFAGTGIESLIVRDNIVLAHVRGWDNPSVVDDNWRGDLVGTLAEDHRLGFRKLYGFKLEQAQAWAENVVQTAFLQRVKRAQIR